MCWGSNANDRAKIRDGKFAQVSAGLDTSCVLANDGQSYCWGRKLEAPGLQQLRFPEVALVSATWGNNTGMPCAVFSKERMVECPGTGQVPKGPFKEAWSGGRYACGLQMDGHLVCWGEGKDGQTQAPQGDYRQLAVGPRHACAITTNSTAKCWGANDRSQSNAPTGDFTYVTVGREHSCGLHKDGTVDCWGNAGAGKPKTPDARFITIAAGGGYTCGLAENEFVECWGDRTITLDLSKPRSEPPQWDQGTKTTTATAKPSTKVDPLAVGKAKRKGKVLIAKQMGQKLEWFFGRDGQGAQRDSCKDLTKKERQVFGQILTTWSSKEPEDVRHAFLAEAVKTNRKWKQTPANIEKLFAVCTQLMMQAEQAAPSGDEAQMEYTQEEDEPVRSGPVGRRAPASRGAAQATTMDECNQQLNRCAEGCNRSGEVRHSCLQECQSQGEACAGAVQDKCAQDVAECRAHCEEDWRKGNSASRICDHCESMARRLCQ